MPTKTARAKARHPRRVAARCTTRGCKRRPAFVGFCRTHAERAADDLWRAPARADGAACELAGVDAVRCGGPLQAAHGIPRRYRGTRWVALNRWVICAGHHRYYTDRWPEWAQVMRARLGALGFDELWRIARDFVGPVDYAVYDMSYAVLGEPVRSRNTAEKQS